jgi:hypothetical protein
MATRKKNEKDHRAKKNTRSAEAYQKQREEQNRSRGKQVWVGGSIKDGGHWDRIDAGSPGN